MKFTPNLIIGVVITLVGSVLVLDRVGLVDFRSALQLWPVLLTLFGVSVIVQALRPREGDASPECQRPIIGPGLVLFLVVVGFLGWRTSERRTAAAGQTRSEASLSLVGIMSEDARTSAAPDFSHAEMLSLMGATRLDLRTASIAEGREAVVDVVGVMGGVEIRVPRDWVVEIKTVAIMGGVKDQRAARPPDALPLPPNAPKLVVTGMVVMGGLVIRS